MSTDYRTLKKVSAQELFDGRLEEYGVREHISSNSTANGPRCLADGDDYISVNVCDDGFVGIITADAESVVPGKILSAIVEVFDTDILSEHQPQYWGFQTQEEWAEAWEQMGRVRREKAYLELTKHLRGKPEDLRQAVAMVWADLTKELEKDATLQLMLNKEMFRNEINPKSSPIAR